MAVWPDVFSWTAGNIYSQWCSCAVSPDTPSANYSWPPHPPKRKKKKKTNKRLKKVMKQHCAKFLILISFSLKQEFTFWLPTVQINWQVVWHEATICFLGPPRIPYQLSFSDRSFICNCSSYTWLMGRGLPM